MDEIPSIKEDAKKITALVKHSGKVTGYQLSDGNVVSKEEGIALAKAGEIKGVGIGAEPLFLMVYEIQNDYSRLMILWIKAEPLTRDLGQIS